jgi:uncharacterized protein YggE
MELKKWRWLSALFGALLVGAVAIALTLIFNSGGKTSGAVAAVPTDTPSPATTVASTPTPTPATPAATQINLNPNRLVTISAVGQVQAAPDVAYLNVGSEVQAPSAREALDKAKTNGDTIRKALLDAGIDEKNIQTSGISAYPVTVPGKDGQPAIEPSSYRAYVNLSITINDLSKAGSALDAATKAGANQVGGVSYAIKDDSALRAQALEQAVKQARPKAEAIARGMGLQLGQVVTVVEDPGGYYAPQAQFASGKGAGDLSPGQLTVGVRVTVSFAIQ